MVQLFQFLLFLHKFRHFVLLGSFCYFETIFFLFIVLYCFINFKIFIFVYLALDVRGHMYDQILLILHFQCLILQNFKHSRSGILQLGEEQQIHIVKNLVLGIVFFRQEGLRLFPGEDDPCRLRAGQGKGVFPQALEFFHVPGIVSARIAEGFRPHGCVKSAQIVVLQKGAAAVRLPENAFLPVHRPCQPFCESIPFLGPLPIGF